MCGILGAFARGSDLPAPDLFARALARLERRGPDDVGQWHDQHVRLGHRRLSILDLSPAGHQPMQSGDGRYVIVFNGEIYNHLELRPRLEPPGGWRSSTDTETLLEAFRAWGPACLEHLNGMFAFAIWDRIERRLFLARDRSGVKPLYYSVREGRFAFASRPVPLALLLGQATIDDRALRAYLELGYIPSPLSFYGEVRKLPAGHTLTVDQSTLCVERYWDCRAIEPDTRTRPEGERVEELDALLRDAVRLRLLSDVPVGAFLSGGVDSGLVVALMRAVGVERPRTFTIGFAERGFDEVPAAARIAAHLEVEHTHERVDTDTMLGLLPQYVDEFDEPFADSAAFPTLALARLARRSVTVALSGDGSDERFGGYHYYPLMTKLAPVLDWPAWIREPLARGLHHLPWHRAHLLAGALAHTDPVDLFHYFRGVSKDYPDLMTTLKGPDDSSRALFADFAAGFPKTLPPAELAMRLDAGFTLVDEYFQKVDVATMAFSLEARCPLTDYRLVEWAARLPLEYKVRGNVTKYLLKQVACRYLPHSLVHQPKKGFGTPLGAWLRGPLRSWAHELIHDTTLMSRLPLDAVAVRELLRVQSSGERAAHPLLWTVLMLLCYVNRHEYDREMPDVEWRPAA
jgi:asparagine synthase (glutamine-hydrolysing)